MKVARSLFPLGTYTGITSWVKNYSLILVQNFSAYFTCHHLTTHTYLSSVIFGLSAVPVLKMIRKVCTFYNYLYLKITFSHVAPFGIENLNRSVGLVGSAIAIAQ